MRLVRVKWGKLYLEVPVELVLYLLFKAFLMFHYNVNVQRLPNTLSGNQPLRANNYPYLMRSHRHCQQISI